MSKKEIAVFSIIVGLIIGTVTWLLVWDYQRDKADFKKQCEHVGRLADKEVYTDNYGECFIINQNKIEKVEL